MGSTPDSTHEPAAVLRELRSGDASAAERLLPLVYTELHNLAAAYFRGQPTNHTLQPTALVHEAYLKLVDQAAADFNDRAHFLAVAARAMRHALVDHARRRNASKRGGSQRPAVIDDPRAPDALCRLDVLALDEALANLAEVDARQASVVELRFFAGLTVDETARTLGVSPRTVELDWRMGKAWLSRALTADADGDP